MKTTSSFSNQFKELNYFQIFSTILTIIIFYLFFFSNEGISLEGKELCEKGGMSAFKTFLMLIFFALMSFKGKSCTGKFCSVLVLMICMNIYAISMIFFAEKIQYVLISLIVFLVLTSITFFIINFETKSLKKEFRNKYLGSFIFQFLATMVFMFGIFAGQN